MSVRAMIEAFRASKSSGHNLLLSRNPQWICTSSWSRPFKAQFYSTDRADYTMKDEADTPVIPKKKRHEDDPERRAKYLRRAREYYAEYYAHTRATDPELLSEKRERMRDLRFQPEVRLYHKEKYKTWYQLQSMKPGFLLKKHLCTWIHRYAWFREDLDWTPWQPMLYADSVEHWCQGCNLARHRGSQLWWRMDPQKLMCHACYMKLIEGGLPKGYEDCTTFKEIAKRKETLETRLSPSPTTSTLASQSWTPSKTSPTSSRSFSTFRALWTKSKEQKLDEEGPAQDSQPIKWTELESEMLAAKHDYNQIRCAWKLAQTLESGSHEIIEADVHKAKLRVRRAKHAWSMVSDPEYKARMAAKASVSNRKPETRELKNRWFFRPENHARYLATARFRRVNDPLHRLKESVDNWTRYYPLARRRVDWTPYQPILYSAKVKFHCQGCGLTRHDGLRLWWRRKPDPAVNVDLEVYSCPHCFMKSPDGGLPKAYKDCTTVRELNTRYQELEGIRPIEDRSSFDVEVETMEQKNHDLGADHRV